MARERDWRDVRADEAAGDERPRRRRVGRKPYALRVTTTYLCVQPIWGGKVHERVQRYETERARDDALRALDGSEWRALGRVLSVTKAEKIDG